MRAGRAMRGQGAMRTLKAEAPLSAAERRAWPSLVAGPHAQYAHHTLLGEDLVYEPIGCAAWLETTV